MAKRLGKTDTRAKAFCDMVISEGYGEFSVIWNKSKTWGSCPSILNHRNEKMAYAGGCGYDKESAVMVELLRFLLPEGEYLSGSGAGFNTLVRELDQHGWTLERTYTGKTEDGYKITRKNS